MRAGATRPEPGTSRPSTATSFRRCRGCATWPRPPYMHNGRVSRCVMRCATIRAGPGPRAQQRRSDPEAAQALESEIADMVAFSARWRAGRTSGAGDGRAGLRLVP
jgi:hypothetical protein